MNISYSRTESAPYSRTMSSGLTTFSSDFDIFSICWVTSTPPTKGLPSTWVTVSGS